MNESTYVPGAWCTYESCKISRERKERPCHSLSNQCIPICVNMGNKERFHAAYSGDYSTVDKKLVTSSR